MNETRTIAAGASISNPIGLSGTLGLCVLNGAKISYALTCAHVVAPPGLDVAGDAVDSPAAATRADRGNQTFGKVEAWSILDPAVTNMVDAALIRVAPEVTLNNSGLGLGSPPSFVADVKKFLLATPTPKVEIHSRSGVIEGVVSGLRDNRIFADLRYSHVLEYATTTAPGDSGSAVVDSATRQVVGLHFAGLDGFGYCIPFESILAFFPDYALTVAA